MVSRVLLSAAGLVAVREDQLSAFSLSLSPRLSQID